MIMQEYKYFSVNFGEARNDTQIRVGYSSKNRVVSYLEITNNYQEDGLIVSDTKKDYAWFLVNQKRDDTWYRESSEREFINCLLSDVKHVVQWAPA